MCMILRGFSFLYYTSGNQKVFASIFYKPMWSVYRWLQIHKYACYSPYITVFSHIIPTLCGSDMTFVQSSHYIWNTLALEFVPHKLEIPCWKYHAVLDFIVACELLFSQESLRANEWKPLGVRFGLHGGFGEEGRGSRLFNLNDIAGAVIQPHSTFSQ